MRLILICTILISCPVIIFSQSISNDSAAVADTTAFRYLQPIPNIGTLSKTDTASIFLADSIINFSNYRYIGDLLETQSGYFIRDFGSLGPLSDINIFGIDQRNISFLADGIQLNEPFSGKYNIYLFPSESIEKIELISGPRSFIYGLNGTGAAINFITKNKKAIKPYSRLRYSESGYGLNIVDGLVSQDVIRGLNITAGTQHMVYGQRFLNENYDGWNARVKLRYNINENVNIFASEMYNQTLLGIWQGVNISKTPDSLRYEVLQATVRNTDAYEKITRHDVQAGTALRLFPDSNAVSMLTLFYTSNVRLDRDLENKIIPNGIFSDNKFVSNWYGAKLTQNFSVDRSNFNFGAEIRSHKILNSPASQKQDMTSSSLYAIGETNIFHKFDVSSFGRIDYYNHTSLLAFGGDAKFKITGSLTLKGGYSRSYRSPLFQELSGIDTIISSNLNNDPERHHLLEIGLAWNPEKNINFELTGFNRIIWNAINISTTDTSSASPYYYSRGFKKIVRGLSLRTNIQLWVFLLEFNGGYLDIVENSKTENSIPRWNMVGGIYYRDKILNNELDLKFGFRGKYFSRYDAFEFNQETGTYLPSADGYSIQPTNCFDLVILAHIGQAYIHLIWDNVFNRQYIMQNFYPMPERQMRFGVSWEFLE
ncbi:MAG: TonB-dependent receptor plug domain-containing protein [Ignavibacteriales bacterium]|nr:TonB-dependent receptor plug domain-containing protein [Ignavibacteriales bacterium]